MEPRMCRIDNALGRTTECPRELCAFWSDNACILTGARVDLATSPGLPHLLFGLRERLGGIGLDQTLIPPGLR
jgi:hypothetical protein